MTDNIHDNLSDEALIDLIKNLESDSDLAEKKLKRAKNALIDRKKSEIELALHQKAEPFGAVSQVIGDMKITFTTPKKVDWDQPKLAALYTQIAADPDEKVEEYIKLEYKVSEDAYKNWPSNLKEAFQPARTTKAGSVSIKIEPVKG